MTAAAQSASDLWRHFATKADLIGASVVYATESAAAGAAWRAAPAESATGLAHTASLAEHLPRLAAQAGARLERGQAPPSEVVALGRLAVVETGSVLIDEPDVDRAGCFLTERLWLVVRAEDLVSTLESALERIERLIRAGSHHPQLVTGPSRTADIERTLTIGVHGPRALVVVVLDA